MAEINWQEICEKGAEKLGESLGTSLGAAIGGPVGAALAKAILGLGSSNDDIAKLEERLAAIEAKLDTLIQYITDKLPEVIYNQALLANLQIEKSRFGPLRTAVMADLATLRESPGDASAARALSMSLNNFLVQGNFLAVQGAPFAPFAVISMTVATAAFVQLVQIDKAYAGALQIWSEAFLEASGAWLDPQVAGSVAYARSRLASTHSRAVHVTTQYPAGVPHALIFLGPKQIWENFNDGIVVPPGTCSYAWHVGYIDDRSGNVWWGGRIGGWPVTFEFDMPRDRTTEIANAIYLGNDNSGNRRPPPVVLDWFPPVEALPAGGFEEIQTRLATEYALAHDQTATLPDRIKLAMSLEKEVALLRQVATSYAGAEQRSRTSAHGLLRRMSASTPAALRPSNGGT